MSEMEIIELLDRWDRQQEGYIREREERFGVMFEILDHAFGDGFTVIDAACGPGSLGKRLLQRFPNANLLALDADVMLLEMARVSLANHRNRVSVIECDLSKHLWPDLVRETVQARGWTAPVALVSTTALHWLSPGELAEFYGLAGVLLAPGGIVMNGDHMRFDSRWPTLAAAARKLRERIQVEAVDSGEDDWAMWWERAGGTPGLSALKAQRDAFYAARRPKRATSGEDCPVDFHVAALRHAGFTEAGTAWQSFDNYVVFGRRPR